MRACGIYFYVTRAPSNLEAESRSRHLGFLGLFLLSLRRDRQKGDRRSSLRQDVTPPDGTRL